MSFAISSLPQSWRVARFDQILTRIERKVILDDSSSYNSAGVRWYGMGAFCRETLLGLQVKRKQQWTLRAGDVVYNKLFAWKNAFAIAGTDVDDCIVSDKFPTYAANSTLVDARYLGYYFRMPQLAQQAMNLSKGAAAISKLTLNPPQFWDLTIPLPPLDEQRRIVARIETLAAHIEEARGLRLESMMGARGLVNAARNSVIGQLSPSWRPLRSVVESIENGHSPACEPRQAADNEWGVLKVGAVSFGAFNQNENKVLSSTYLPDIRYEVRQGDFLMCRANTRELVGTCAIVRSTRPRLMLSDKTFRFVFNSRANINPDYLDQVLKSSALRQQIERQATVHLLL